jgi:hypothetical protein
LSAARYFAARYSASRSIRSPATRNSRRARRATRGSTSSAPHSVARALRQETGTFRSISIVLVSMKTPEV